MIFGTRRKGWTPLVLRWRRRRALRPIFKAAGVTTRVSMSFFPRVHFHYTTHVSNQNHHQHAVHKIFPATTVKRERVLVERRFYSQVNANSVHRIKHISAPIFSKHTHLYASSKQSASIPKQIHQPRASASCTSVFTMRQHTRRVELTRISQIHSHIREHRSQTLAFRSEREILAKSAQIYFERAEELVWRRTRPRTTVTENTVATNNPETLYRQPVRTVAVETQVQSAAPASNLTTPQQITSLDPRLLDRLTDDVIRRVEKRAIIERQRRGL